MNTSVARFARFACAALPSLVLVTAATATAAAAEPKTFRRDHVEVRYDGITEAQATSLARVAELARTSALDRFGFDVPELIHVNVDCRIGNPVRLFTDGQDTYTLSIRTGFDLGPPGVCGIYNLYGMCHELGHVVMYRPLKERRWLKSGAAEGWAHYFGSRVVDDVWSAEGEKVWWMPYDYHAEGMERLTTTLQQGDADETSIAAGTWMELASIVGEKRMPAVFAGWNAAKMDLTDPGPALLAELKRVANDDPRLDAWWVKARPVLVFAVPRSDFAAAPASRPSTSTVAKGPNELAADDGKSAGKMSIAGSGHAVSFEAPGEGYLLSAVKVYGSRYGAPDPPAEDFHVYLCDHEGKQIADLPFGYKNFTRGGQRWVTLKLAEAKQVPKDFILCVSFNPTATKGVYVHYDKAVDGDSRTGLPGQLNGAFEKGDWMIRAVVAPPK